MSGILWYREAVVWSWCLSLLYLLALSFWHSLLLRKQLFGVGSCLWIDGHWLESTQGSSELFFTPKHAHLCFSASVHFWCSLVLMDDCLELILISVWLAVAWSKRYKVVSLLLYPNSMSDVAPSFGFCSKHIQPFLLRVYIVVCQADVQHFWLPRFPPHCAHLRILDKLDSTTFDLAFFQT